MFLFFVLAVVITSWRRSSADSAEIVVTRSSTIRVVEIDRGLTKDFATPGRSENSICLPNGKGIAFVAPVKYGRDFARELLLMEPQQKKPTQITSDMDVRLQFSVAPDGEQLAYVSNKTKQVYVVRVDTRQSAQLTTALGGVSSFSTGAASPVWSPDGKRLAFAYFERDTYRTSFHVLDTLTRRLVTIPSPPATAPITWSPWSPDGTKLVLGGMPRTIIVDVMSDPPRIIREFPGYVQDVHWSPDGTKLAFTQGEEGKYCDSVYVLDLQSGSTKRVSPWFLERRCFHGPSWSPDSKMLAFLGYYSRGDMSLLPWPATIFDQLYIADNDMNVRRVTEDLGESNIYGASWCATSFAFRD